jgi:hypothetical protein
VGLALASPAPGPASNAGRATARQASNGPRVTGRRATAHPPSNGGGDPAGSPGLSAPPPLVDELRDAADRCGYRRHPCHPRSEGIGVHASRGRARQRRVGVHSGGRSRRGTRAAWRHPAHGPEQRPPPTDPTRPTRPTRPDRPDRPSSVVGAVHRIRVHAPAPWSGRRPPDSRARASSVVGAASTGFACTRELRPPESRAHASAVVGAASCTREQRGGVHRIRVHAPAPWSGRRHRIRVHAPAPWSGRRPPDSRSACTRLVDVRQQRRVGVHGSRGAGVAVPHVVEQREPRTMPRYREPCRDAANRRGATPRVAANHAAMPRTGACGRRGPTQGSRGPGASRRPHPAVDAAEAPRAPTRVRGLGRRPPVERRRGATPRDAANHAAMPRCHAAMPCRICHVPCRPCIMPCRKCHAWQPACRAHAARTTLAFVVPTAEIRLAAPKAHRILQQVAAYRWNLGGTVFTAPLERSRADLGALGALARNAHTMH